MLIAYAAGLLTLPACAALWLAVGWSFAREVGRPEAQPGSSCYVCTHFKAYGIGDRSNLTAWIGTRWHRYFWATRKWHRDAWRAHPVYTARARRRSGA